MMARRLSDLAKHLTGFGKSSNETMKTQVATELEAALAQAVKDGKVPHAIVYATNKDGSFYYHHSSGLQNYGVNDEPVQDDPMLMLASQTKLLTAISVLKATELGLIGLDDDVSTIIPELGQQKILTGFNEDTDEPILVDRINPITLRQLCTHSSGTSYSFHPKLMRYLSSQDLPGGTIRDYAPTLLERFATPLIFEPGTSWMYSPGLDWAGLVLERISGQTLEAFQQTHLWPALNLTASDITFWPTRLPALRGALPGLVLRDGDSDALVPNGTAPHVTSHVTDCLGGVGGHARLSAYLAVQRSLLADDGKLLTPASVAVLFTPQLGAASVAALNATWHAGGFNAWCPGDFSDAVPVQYALGGMVFEADDPGRRRKGTLTWGGMFNPFWLIDRDAGLAFTFGTQVLPPGDPAVKEVTGMVERAVYKMAGLDK